MSDKIKNKVRIGPYEYEIRYVEELKNGGGEDLYGHIDYPVCVIRVRDEYRKSQRLPFIVWHEFLHGIIEAAGLEGSDEKEIGIEDIIRVLTPGIVELIRANRWVGKL